MTKSFGFYFLIFTAVFIGASILVAIIGSFLSSGLSGMTVVIPFIAASSTGGLFLKKEQRLPSEAERKKLTNGSFLIYVAFNGFIVGVFILAGGLSELSSGGLGSTFAMIMIGVLLFISLIIYLMIRWAYGSLLTKQAGKMDLKNNTFD